MILQKTCALLGCIISECVAPDGNSMDTGGTVVLCRFLQRPRLCRNRVEAEAGEIFRRFGGHGSADQFQTESRLMAGSSVDSSEKRAVGLAFDDPLQIKRDLARVVISPHARFTVGNEAFYGYMIPPVGPVIDGVQDEAMMACIGA